MVQVFTYIPYVQKISKPKKCILPEVGIEVAIKPMFTLSSVFRKTKNPIELEKERGLVDQISCRGCDAVYHGKTERSVKTRTMKHACAANDFDPK